MLPWTSWLLLFCAVVMFWTALKGTLDFFTPPVGTLTSAWRPIVAWVVMVLCILGAVFYYGVSTPR